MTPTFSCPTLSLWGWCWLSGGMIQLWRGSQGEVGVEVLVQQAAVFFCTITCSIMVLWITSIAGDNRQAAKRSGWHRTPASRWETVWIISRLPADCLQEVVVVGGGGAHVWAGVWGASVGTLSAQSGSVGGADGTSKMASASHSSWPYSYAAAWFKRLLKFHSGNVHFWQVPLRLLGPRWEAFYAETALNTGA